jgi:hypothetical protein
MDISLIQFVIITVFALILFFSLTRLVNRDIYDKKDLLAYAMGLIGLIFLYCIAIHMTIEFNRCKDPKPRYEKVREELYRLKD